MIVVGMMSGTSTDGIDAVAVRFENNSSPALQWELLAHVHIPFPTALHQEILACVRADAGTVDRLCALNFELGEIYSDAARQVIRAAKLDSEQIDLIGNHGQTVWHIPQHSTLQIGSAAVIAERTGITTISNFRARDMAAGGHGAPLVSFLDARLFTHPQKNRALQNIGGIANVTWLPAQHPDNVLAFDSGPGNVLIDDAVRRATNNAFHFDRDGAMAAHGRVDADWLAELLTHPYFKLLPPKTTGREVFGSPFGEQLWSAATARGLKAEDIVATVTMLTAKSIADSYRAFLPTMPEEVIVSGGGAKNPTLLAMLDAQLDSKIPVRRIDEFGIPGDAKEAFAFALMAFETWHGRPSNLPSATGARHPVILGEITPGRNWQELASK